MARAADKKSELRASIDIVDSIRRQLLIVRNAELFVWLRDFEEMMRNFGAFLGSRLARADIHELVDLATVGANDFAAIG